MKLQELFNSTTEIYEEIIDASNDFKKKRSNDFTKKIQNVLSDIPNVFQHQRDLEEHVSNSIQSLQANINKRMTKYRLQLAPVLKEYHNSMFIPLVFYFNEDDLVTSFLKEHGDEMLDLMKIYEDGLNNLKNWSKEQNWPTGTNSLTKYTNFRYAVREASDIVNAIKKAMSSL